MIECSADPRDTKVTVTIPSGIRHTAGSTNGPGQPPSSKLYAHQGTPSTGVIDANAVKTVSDLGDAINYLNKVKVLVAFVSAPRDSVTHMPQDRFSQRPEIYKNFIEILHNYQGKLKPIQDLYSQAKHLFHSTPDLLEEFEELFPEFAVRARMAKVDADVAAGRGNP